MGGPVLLSCVVVIPIYKSEWSAEEHLSISHSLKNLGGHPVCWLCPETLDTREYSAEFGVEHSVRFPPAFFTSIENYSRLLLSAPFYEVFKSYDFMLICQPDAIVLRPELTHWLNLSAERFDYLGAPWPKGWEFRTSDFMPERFPEGTSVRAFVGNGGLSLRRIRGILDLLNEFEDFRARWYEKGLPEDLFISFAGANSMSFRVPNPRLASLFAQELEPAYLAQLNNNELPFGIHGWPIVNRNYWESQPWWPGRTPK